MPRVFKTAQAETDLQSIWLHIASDSPSEADAWLDALLSVAQFLSEQPLMGRARPDLLGEAAPDLRSFPVKTYVLFYRPLSDGIEIIRVFHGARDQRKLGSP